MLAIVVAPEGEPTWRRTYAAAEIRIGKAATNHLALAGQRVANEHARLMVHTQHAMFLTNVSRAHRTYIDGARVTDLTRVTFASRIVIDRYTLTVARFVPEHLAAVQIRDATEQRLIDAVASGDDASRVVYADWLEARGELARAEYLRLQIEIATLPADAPAFQRASGRLVELATMIDVGWRSRVSHAPVEGCRFDLACPKQWSAMAPTAEEGVRHCSACNETVHYCASVEDARAHAARGQCVALDVTSPRWPDDLGPPFGQRVCVPCGIDVGYGLDHCPRCGHNFVRSMVRGRYIAR